MKITYLELLEMIRDGKAPKKVKYKDIKYTCCSKSYQPENNTNVELARAIINEVFEFSFIDKKCIEIIEEEPELKEIEKLSYQQIGTEYEHKKTVQDINKQICKLGNKINELIDSHNKIIRKSEDK